LREALAKQPLIPPIYHILPAEPGPTHLRAFLNQTCVLVVVAFLSLIFTYRLAKALKMRYAGLSCVLVLIPPLGLVVMLLINGKAVSVLRSEGITVGVLGAQTADLEEI
jgi:hypothetical protein